MMIFSVLVTTHHHASDGATENAQLGKYFASSRASCWTEPSTRQIVWRILWVRRWEMRPISDACSDTAADITREASVRWWLLMAVLPWARLDVCTSDRNELNWTEIRHTSEQFSSVHCCTDCVLSERTGSSKLEKSAVNVAKVRQNKNSWSSLTPERAKLDACILRQVTQSTVENVVFAH